MRNCPPCASPALLTAIPNSLCSEDWININRIAFQLQSANYSFASAAAITTLANWTGLLSAIDNTKVVITPTNKFIKGKLTPGEPIKTSDTPNGIERIIKQVQTSKFTGEFIGLTPAEYDAIVTLLCSGVVMYPITLTNEIITKTVSPTDIRGIVLSPQTMNLKEPETDDTPAGLIRFMFEVNLQELDWYSDYAKYSTDFALTM